MTDFTPVVIFWFRRDLRLSDNHGLYQALTSGWPVIPLFIFDPAILSKLPDPQDRRVDFIHQTILKLSSKLQKNGAALLVKHNSPEVVFKELLETRKVVAVYTNHDYEPAAIERDTAVANVLKAAGVNYYSYKDQVVFDKHEVTKPDGKPYTVFTPYKKRWLLKLEEVGLESFSTENYYQNFLKMAPEPVPTLNQLGFRDTDVIIPAHTGLEEIIRNYHATRDYPFLAGTTRLSVHLRFGTVSIRQVTALARQLNPTWLNELIWRDFYHMILYHFPGVVNQAFKPAYDHIPWLNNEADFEKWCAGQTGYPLVDAGMRELNNTGFMHNRVRMVVASFLCKHLLIDWRWGETYFAGKLLDYDLAANNGGWQWAAGSGCDASPYFRVFNPTAQNKKFDRDYLYVKKWVPEWESSNYAKPLIDHNLARNRVIQTYKAALSKYKNGQQ